MKSIAALASKDILLLQRDRVGFFFVFFFPLIYAVFFGAIFSGAGEGGVGAMKIIVVDEDDSSASRRFAGLLEESTEFIVTRGARVEAADRVRRGDQVAYVVLPRGFQEAANAIFQGEPISLAVGVDPGRQAESAMIKGLLTQYAFQTLQNVLADRGAMQRQAQMARDAISEADDIDAITKMLLVRFMNEIDHLMAGLPASLPAKKTADEESAAEDAGGAIEGLGDWSPVEIEVESVLRERIQPRSSYEITMPQAFVWLLLGCSAAFAVSLVMERTRGTLVRLKSAPITLTHILAGKALACFLTTIVGLAVLFLVFRLGFGVRPDSYPLLALALVSAAIAFVGIMMLISVMGKTEASVGGIGWAFLLIMAMTGGGMIPLMFMPGWMKTVSNLSFVKWAVLAVEGAVWRGFSLTEMLLPCGILVGIGAAAFLVGVRVFKITAD